jgi:hypothetical protein
MQQPQLTAYPDIAEVRTVTGVVACNQLLAEGWVLLGVYPLTAVAEMTPVGTDGEQRKQDTQRYVRRLVGYVVGQKARVRMSQNGPQRDPILGNRHKICRFILDGGL